MGSNLSIPGRLAAPYLGVALVAAIVASGAQASVEISSAPTKNMTCSGGVCAPTAQKAVLNTTDLANMLETGDVKVVTGNGAVTITVSSSFSWASAHQLTLDANFNVSFKAPVVVAGPGGLTITTNDGGTGGDLIFFEGGKVDFWDLKSGLIVDGVPFVLAKDINSLATDIAQSPSGAYALAKDYKFARYVGARRPPIHTPFYGRFEGLGHTLRYMKVESVAMDVADTKLVTAGLFAYLGGQVRSIRLTNTIVISQGVAPNYPQYVGALAGYIDRNGNVDDVHVSVKIGTLKPGHPAAGYSGGIAGGNYGSILGSSASGTVNCAYGCYAGGIAGISDGSIVRSNSDASMECRLECTSGGLVGFNGGSIDQSGASGASTVEKYGDVGGLVGQNGGAISRSFSTGAVSVGGPTTESYHGYGGLVGRNTGTIDQSFASGSVAGGANGSTGGLVGSNFGVITNSYATGAANIDNSGAVGGLVGRNSSTEIRTSYSIGAPSVSNGTSLLGGLVGEDNAAVGGLQFTYWDKDTSGVGDPSQGAGNISNDTGVKGLTDVQLKSRLPAAFDTEVWGQLATVNNGYPYLLALPPG